MVFLVLMYEVNRDQMRGQFKVANDLPEFVQQWEVH